MNEINVSLDFDRRLATQDIAGSRAHAAMLAETGIISAEDAAAIAEGLTRIEEEIEAGSFPFKPALEDIHMNVEARLAELIGEPAGRLHTARSRNDQVATGFRLWTRSALEQFEAACRDLQSALLARAEAHTGTILPGFTHLQSAQPVSFAHHLLAYVEMLGRDRDRARAARQRLNECPLGAGALAGTSFPIDRDMTADALGFDRPAANSLDAVSDRDFALDYLSVTAICGTHLSRLAEELVIWCSEPFGFVRLSDAFTTGSSMMPQKRNPDAAELVRAKSGRLIGGLIGLLTVMKGLPMAYSKDMQEDKEPVFAAHDTISLCLAATAGMIRDLEPVPGRMRAALDHGHPAATELADWLVQALGIPFRRSHHIVGQAVKAAEARGCALKDLPLATLQEIEPGIDDSVFAVLTVEAALHRRNSFGGTAPDRVREAIAAARERFL